VHLSEPVLNTVTPLEIVKLPDEESVIPVYLAGYSSLVRYIPDGDIGFSISANPCHMVRGENAARTGWSPQMTVSNCLGGKGDSGGPLFQIQNGQIQVISIHASGGFLEFPYIPYSYLCDQITQSTGSTCQGTRQGTRIGMSTPIAQLAKLCEDHFSKDSCSGFPVPGASPKPPLPLNMTRNWLNLNP
jgi:hypothetical protein